MYWSRQLTPQNTRIGFSRLAKVLLPLAAVYIGIILLGEQRGITADDLTRDPAATENFLFYVGLVSHAGVIIWISAVAIALFAAGIVRTFS